MTSNRKAPKIWRNFVNDDMNRWGMRAKSAQDRRRKHDINHR